MSSRAGGEPGDGADVAEDSALGTTLHTLPGWAARGLVYLLTALLAAALTWAAIGSVSELVTVNAVVVPEGRLRLAQAPVAGVVERIHVRRGEDVQAGDVLITLNAESVATILLERQLQQEQLELVERHRDDVVPEDIAHLREQIASEQRQFERLEDIHEQAMARLDEQTTRYEGQIENIQDRLALIETQLTINRRLEEEGLAARNRVLEVQQALAEAKTRLAEMESLAREVTLERRIDRQEFARERERYQQTVAKLEREIETRQTEADRAVEEARVAFEHADRRVRFITPGAQLAELDAEANVAVIRAPAAGRVADVAVRNPGQTLERGATVATIVPTEANLVAELHVPDSEVGRLEEGQRVRMKFAAFPYQQHGVLVGELGRVPPGVEETREGGEPYYRVPATLDQAYFRVAGEQQPLLPGMTITAEIVTGEQTILSRFLRPLGAITGAEEASP